MSKLLIAFMLGFTAANIIHTHITPEDAYRAGAWVRRAFGL